MVKRFIFLFAVLFLCGITPVYGEEVEVPIIMYHLVTKNGRLLGKYGISPAELEKDLQYLQDEGYETVVMADLIAFVKDGGQLPDKPIVLTFDDGNFSDYSYLYPLLQKYDMKAVVSVLGRVVDECTVLAANYEGDKIFPNLTWEQIKEMDGSEYVEIQSHSYDLHGAKGSGQRNGEADEDYQNRLREDLQKLQAQMKESTGREPDTFTYPYGIISDSAKPVLEELGFEASLSCRSGVNVIKQGDMSCLYRLKRDNRASGQPVSGILKGLVQ